MLVLLLLASSFSHAAPDATARVKRAEENTRGKTLQADVRMVITRDGSDRTLKFKVWTEGLARSTVKILEPARDRGTANLRQEFNLWQFLPKVDQVIKIPSSLMLQSWMGSDFTNDDLVKSSSLVRDYSHAIAGQETIDGAACVKVTLTPKPDAPVAWGKVHLWVREADGSPVRQEFLTEKGEVVKVMTGKNHRKFGTHVMPTELTMSTPKKPGASTKLIYEKVTFDAAIPGSVFTQEFLRKPAS